MTSLAFGYVRVSTTAQTLDQQVDALQAAGVSAEDIFEDKLSGARTDRPGLARLLEVARQGDTITVVALDRLGRSMTHVIRTIEELNQRGVVLKSLRESIDFSTPTGKLMASVMSSLAEYERELIKERAAAAREAAIARGKQVGRPRALSEDQMQLARRMHSAGESVSTISAFLSVSRATVYRALGDIAAALEGAS